MKKILIIALLFCGTVCVAGCGNSNTSSAKTTWNCIDVTSYDHDRNNDMKCVSSDGDVKYTSYEGANVLESL